MRKLLYVLLGFAPGLAVGYVLHPNPKSRPAVASAAGMDFSSPVAVYRPDAGPLVLTPHAGVIRGVGVRYAEPPDGKPVWVVTLDNGRVALGCTESRQP